MLCPPRAGSEQDVSSPGGPKRHRRAGARHARYAVMQGAGRAGTRPLGSIGRAVRCRVGTPRAAERPRDLPRDPPGHRLLLVGTLTILDASRRHARHAWAARISFGLGPVVTMWENIVPRY